MKLPTPTDIGSLAKLILHPDCQNIGVLSGAGISVASGIPDFRSPGGMYDTLRPELITASQQQRQWMEYDPTYVVTWDMFQHNQFPYMEVRRPFILGTQEQKWKATIAHRFFELLHTKTLSSDADNKNNQESKLTRIYTQNIDGLDFQCTKIPRERIIGVHGSIAEVGCEGCGTDMDFDEFCDKVRNNIKDIYNVGPRFTLVDSDDDDDDDAQSPSSSASATGPSSSTPILCPNCHRPLVKPKTVLFGRQLPEEFFISAQKDLPNLDLLLIVGTSLVVSPANSVAYNIPKSTIRVVVNMEPVGQELGIVYNGNMGDGRKTENNEENDDDPSHRDFFAQGPCDEVFLQLIQELGWIDDLVSIQDLLPPASQELLRKHLEAEEKQEGEEKKRKYNKTS